MKKAMLIEILLLILVINGCVSEESLEKEAEKVAQGFSIAWQNEDYSSLYNYFPSTLKSMRNKGDFVKFVHATNPQDFKLIYDKIVLQNKNEAYAYYTFAGNYLFQPKTPAIHMVYEEKEWKIDTFAYYFTESCAKEYCIDGNVCTLDICNNETDFLCKHEHIKNCCNFDSDCPKIKPYCHNHSCYKETCFTDEDCSRGVCNPNNNKCVACLKNSDCSKGACNPKSNECVECMENSDCLSGACNFEINKCVECNSNSDCSWGGVCNPTSNECVVCLTNKDCGRYSWGDKWKICKKNKCIQCVENEDCNFSIKKKVCLNGLCIGCITDDDCPDDKECCSQICKYPDNCDD